MPSPVILFIAAVLGVLLALWVIPPMGSFSVTKV